MYATGPCNIQPPQALGGLIPEAAFSKTVACISYAMDFWLHFGVMLPQAQALSHQVKFINSFAPTPCNPEVPTPIGTLGAGPLWRCKAIYP